MMLTSTLLSVSVMVAAHAAFSPGIGYQFTTVYAAVPSPESDLNAVIPGVGSLAARQELQEHNSCLYNPALIHYCVGLHFRDPCWVTTPANGVCSQLKDEISSFRAPNTHGCVLFTDDTCGGSGGNQWSVFPSEAHGDLTRRRFPYKSFLCAENIRNWKREAAPSDVLVEDNANMITAEDTLAAEGFADREEIDLRHINQPPHVRSAAIAMDLKNIFYCENFDFQFPCYQLPAVENVCKQWIKQVNSFRAPSTHDCILYSSKSCDEGNGPKSVYRVAKGDAVGALKLAAGYPHQSYVCKNDL